jgi:ribosomal protein S18 acetylase RimI-like enzyme
MLMCTHELNAQHLMELDALMCQCRKHDLNVIPVYPHFLAEPRPLPCNVLYYQQQQLVGFLSLYFFYETACEMAVMVSPTWRRRGIARQMLASALPLVSLRELREVICSSPSQLNNDWFLAHGWQYKNTELHMQWRGSLPTEPSNPAIRVRPATTADIPFLVEIDNLCFATSKSAMVKRFTALLQNSSYQLFVILYGDQLVGKAHLQHKSNQVHLSDIAILPQRRRQGFGRCLIEHSVRFAQCQYALPTHLDVEADNQQAVSLYQSMGFESINTCDFWQIGVEQLTIIR